MGFLSTLFGGNKEHAPLDPASPALPRLERSRAALEDFARRVHDDLEIVPGAQGTYVFVGKPPKTFGIVWFHDGIEHNFKILMKEKGLGAAQVQILSDELRDAYARSAGEPRFRYELAGRQVLVTPSPTLEQQVAEIVGRVA